MPGPAVDGELLPGFCLSDIQLQVVRIQQARFARHEYASPWPPPHTVAGHNLGRYVSRSSMGRQANSASTGHS